MTTYNYAEQFTASGELSPKQINCVLNPLKWNRKPKAQKSEYSDFERVREVMQ